MQFCVKNCLKDKKCCVNYACKFGITRNHSTTSDVKQCVYNMKECVVSISDIVLPDKCTTDLLEN